jgi:hypothetical protein
VALQAVEADQHREVDTMTDAAISSFRCTDDCDAYAATRPPAYGCPGSSARQADSTTPAWQRGLSDHCEQWSDRPQKLIYQ